ncbi:MAG: crossover junction endodeoxyribonuclease RuvC [Alphaproteobacteria bacterium]|nr:crossover junction endodeoxyribonuclease RuvC [Alphaproteobacteria bacterium]MBR1756660.1 crossover junction endodeoxyribonuclease RuvC [Alphaproteobacteria bacterium]
MRILGLDPSLSSTGWGVIEVNGNRLQYIADGFIPTQPKMPIEERLDLIFRTLNEVIETYRPVEAAIEKTFLNQNPESSLKLSMARGVVILSAGYNHIPLFEYEPNKVKKALVGVGHADKNQVETMVKILLPGCQPKNNDSSDALAMAITHSHYRGSAF